MCILAGSRHFRKLSDDMETVMLTRVRKWGNSQGVRLPRQVLEETRIGLGDEVSITAEGGRILVEPTQWVRGRYRLEDLVARMDAEDSPGEVDWGPPVGREVW